MKKITLLLVMLLFGIASNAQFVENFDDDSVTAPTGNVWNLPSGQWQIFNEGAGNMLWNINPQSFPAYSNPRSAYLNRENIGQGQTSRNFLVTPIIQNSGLMELRFWTRTFYTADTGTEFLVLAAPASADPADPASFTIPVAQWDEQTLLETFDEYTEKVVTLNTGQLGTQFYLAFVKQYTQPSAAISGERWSIDDVRVITPCLAPTNLSASPLATSATLNWVGVPSSTYYVHVVPAGTVFDGTLTGAIQVTGALSTVVTSTTLPTAAPLQPDTLYEFYVYADCGLSTSPWSEVEDFRTSVAPPECGGIFTDTGGSTANYSNSENYVITICPDTPGEMVIVAFTSFETEANYDGLLIYNGDSVTAPQISSGTGTGNGPLNNITGAFWGTNSPGTVEAENPTGCLTFRFLSDSSSNRIGWVANVSCVVPPDCARPTMVQAPVVLHNQAQVTWVATPGVTDYEVLILPCGSTPSATATGTPVTGTSHTFENLTGSTCYTVFIRAICATENSLWTSGLNVTTPMTPPACGGFFYDNGGPNANYSNSSNYTVTICPENEGDVVTIQFTAFETEANWDGLIIYNGASTAAPQISSGAGAGFGAIGAYTGAYWGTNSPGTVIAENATGCLTFRFISDGGGNRTGWTANVICSEAPACMRASGIVTSGVTHQSFVASWTAAPDVTDYLVFALPCGSQPPTQDTMGGVAVTGTTHTFENLTSDTCYVVYVISVCPDGEGYSMPNNSANVNTSIAPPACGGMFTDNGGQNANYLNSSNYTITICPENPGDLVTIQFLTFETETNWDGLLIYDGDSVDAPQIMSGAGAGFGPIAAFTGAFWGTNSPGLIEAGNATGCLTFRFISDGGGNRPGWTAQVTCGPPPTCMRPNGLTVETLLHNLAEISWNPVEGATEYILYAVPCGQPAPAVGSPGGVETTEPNATIEGLTGTTCYTFYVYANCEVSEDDWSPVSIPVSATTSVTPPACGELFTDQGGATGNYLNSSDYTVTICPENPGEMVTVQFTAFETEANWDGLLIYDGPSTNSPQIASTNGAGQVGVAGSFWGTGSPGTVASSHNSGCLTFRFKSDGVGNRPGWVANVICSPQPNCYKPDNFTIVEATPYTFTVSWDQTSLTGENIPTQWEVIMVPAGQSIDNITGFIVDTLPYTVGGLQESACYDFYIRALCPGDEGGYSMWLFESRVCTLPTNDACEDAITLTVNPNLFCAQATTGNLSGATGSNFTSTCTAAASSADDDVWYTFTATAESHMVTVQNINGGSGLGFEVLSGSCEGTFTSIHCESSTTTTIGSSVSEFIIDEFVVGQTYMVRVFSTGTNAVSTAFSICIGQIPCLEAEPFCGEQPITYENATNIPSLGSVGCLFTTPNPAFFFLEVKETGPLNYLMTQSTVPQGAPNLDVDYVTWGPFASNAAACEFVSNLSTTNMIAQGTCPSLHGCSYSAQPTETVCIPNAQQCEVYVIMITNYANQSGYITFTQSNLNSPAAGETNCYAVNTFNYDSVSYCQSNPDPAPILAFGAIHGVYTSTAGLVVDPVTGVIDLSESTPGTYEVTSTLSLTDTSCQNNSTVIRRRTVIIYESPEATLSYPENVYCENEPMVIATLESNKPNGVFSALPQGLSIHPIDGSIFPGGSLPGNYVVSYTIPATQGCDEYSVTFDIEIIPSASAPVVQDIEACNSYILPALEEGAIYLDAAGQELAAGSSITSSQTITVQAGEGECSVEVTFDVTISTLAGVEAPESVSACDSYTLATPAQGGYFSAPNGQGTVLDGATLSATTTVYWFIQSGTCDVEYSFTVSISATPVVTDYPDVTICDSYELPQLTAGAYYDAAGNILAAGTTLTSSQTIYVREYAEDNAECFGEDQIELNIATSPVVTLQSGCIDNVYTVVATVTNAVEGVAYNYVWYAPNGNVVGTNSSELQLTSGDLGTYEVEVSVANATCPGTAYVNVESTQCQIQKGISADGDGLNDSFDLAGYSVSKLSIYNRYGMKVYDMGNYSSEFTGIDNDGNELPVGTYYYVIELSNGAPTITGWLYIAR